MKKILVLGASGATGRLLVMSLLKKEISVIAMVRDGISLASIDSSSLQIVEASITKISINDLSQYIKECSGVISCLGHNLTFSGMFGQPIKLVTKSIEKVAKTIELINFSDKINIILMNTTGNSNRDIPEKPPYSQKIIVFIIRYLLPPHRDNEQASDFLRLGIGQNSDKIDWVVVRPDGLIDEDQTSQYDICASPTRNPIFDSGVTSRINVADF